MAGGSIESLSKVNVEDVEVAFVAFSFVCLLTFQLVRY